MCHSGDLLKLPADCLTFPSQPKTQLRGRAENSAGTPGLGGTGDWFPESPGAPGLADAGVPAQRCWVAATGGAECSTSDGTCPGSEPGAVQAQDPLKQVRIGTACVFWGAGFMPLSRFSKSAASQTWLALAWG